MLFVLAVMISTSSESITSEMQSSAGSGYYFINEFNADRPTEWHSLLTGSRALYGLWVSTVKQQLINKKLFKPLPLK